MIGELLINGKDAYNEFDVSVGDKFPSAPGDKAGLREYITNDDRTRDGIGYCRSIPKMNERALTLTFTIMNDSQAGSISKKDLLYGGLSRGDMVLSVPKNNTKVCHLKFKDTIGMYAQNVGRTFCKIDVKFIEPSPRDRE